MERVCKAQFSKKNREMFSFSFIVNSPVTSCILSHDGTTIVSGGEDRLVKVWDARNAKAPRNVIRCHAAVNKLSVSIRASDYQIVI